LKEMRPATSQADGVRLEDNSSTSSEDDSDLGSIEAKHAADDQMINGTTLTDLLAGSRASGKKPSIQVVTGS